MKYNFGRGVSENDSDAVGWYRKAAEVGHAGAQYALGWMYYIGDGIPQDYGEAFKWYRKAAQQGYASTQFYLGWMYENGEGVDQSYVTAHVWYNLARVHDNEKAHEYSVVSSLPLLFCVVHVNEKAREYRDRIAEKMTPVQIAEAQRLAREWKPKKDD